MCMYIYIHGKGKRYLMENFASAQIHLTFRIYSKGRSRWIYSVLIVLDYAPTQNEVTLPPVGYYLRSARALQHPAAYQCWNWNTLFCKIHGYPPLSTPLAVRKSERVTKGSLWPKSNIYAGIVTVNSGHAMGIRDSGQWKGSTRFKSISPSVQYS